MDANVPIEIDDALADSLAISFGLELGEARDEALDPVIVAIAQAAFEEYVLYLSGARVPAGIRDLRELRLRLLAERLPNGIPGDAQVAMLFHLTLSQARNLIAGTRARYPDEFQGLFKEAAKNALRRAEPLGEGKIRMTMGRSLAALIRDVLTDSVAPPPIPLADASGRYDLAKTTVDDLCKQLGLDRAEVGAQFR